MLNVIHTADFHLDSPFSGLSAQRAAQRREEQRELLDRLANLAAARSADLVLLSGDLLDSERIYPETAQALARCLERIAVPVFIAPGNHDPYGPASLYAAMEWPDNVHIFTSPQIQAVELSARNCVVYGAAFTGPRQETSPLAGFRAPRDGRIHLMVLHGDVGGGPSYGPIDPEDIADSGLTYLALGHVHAGSGLQRRGRTWWAYPGCPEGRGFDETGDKGVLALQIASAEVWAEQVPLCRRRYFDLTVDLTGREDPLAAVEAALPPDAGEDILRIRLTGEHTLDGAGLRRLDAELGPRFWGLELQDHTRLPRDLWARSAEDTLTGLFLRTMAARCRQAPEDETLQLAVRFGLAALERGEDIAP